MLCISSTVSGEWSSSPEDAFQPLLYFCSSKLQFWSNMADTAQEACARTKENLSRYFEQKHKDIASQLVGKMRKERNFHQIFCVE